MEAYVSCKIRRFGDIFLDKIDISDEEYAACETEAERDALLTNCWIDWRNKNIDGRIALVHEEGKQQ